MERLVPAEAAEAQGVGGGRDDPAAAQPVPRDRHDDAGRHPGRGDVQRRLDRRARRAHRAAGGRRRAAGRSRSRASRSPQYIIAAEEPILEATAEEGSLPAAGGQLPGAARSARLGSANASHALGLRLPVGGLRARGEAEVGLLRPADAVRRSVRRPHRAPPGPQGEDAAHPRHLVPGRLRPDGDAPLHPCPPRRDRGVSVLRGRRHGHLAAHTRWPRARAQPCGRISRRRTICR